MTFRSGDLERNAPARSLSDFSKGQKVDGVIKRIEDYGAFVQIQDTSISGLCHKSEV
jgi:rRNA biogenesis protein RRP5